MADERRVSLVILRCGRWVTVSEQPEVIIQLASDVGGPRFLELEQADCHDPVWVAAAEIAMVSPARAVNIAEVLAHLRGPATERMS